MPPTSPTPDFEQRLRSLRFFIAAMAASLVMLAAVAVYLNSATAGGRTEIGQALLYVAGPFFAVCLIASWGVKRWLTASCQKRSAELDDDALAASYQTMTIIRATLLEAPAFLFLATFFLSDDLGPLIAAGVALILLLGLGPTQGSFRKFIDQVRGTSSGPA